MHEITFLIYKNMGTQLLNEKEKRLNSKHTTSLPKHVPLFPQTLDILLEG